MGAPWRAFGFGGAFALILLAAAAPALLGPLPQLPVLLLLLAGGAAWALALRLAREGGPGAGWIFLSAAVLRLVALAGEPGTSDDIHRYVWEGGLLLSGRSPYALAPDDPALAELRERWPGTSAQVNNPGVSAAYPPLTQAASAMAVGLAGGPERGDGSAARRSLRILYTLCDLAVLLPLGLLLRRRGLPAALALAWGWCPLVVLEFAGAGHFDSLGIALLLAALSLAVTGRRPGLAPGSRGALGAVVLSLATLVKLLPLGLAPLLLRGSGARRGLALALLVGALCFAPLLFLEGRGSGLLSGLSEYGLRWESGSLLYRWVERPLRLWLPRDGSCFDARRVGRCAVALLWVWVILRERARARDPLLAAGAVLGAFLILSPTLHPWYLTWVVPFLALQGQRAFVFLVAVAPLLYWPLAGWRSAQQWVEPAWLWPVLALPFLLLLVADRVRPVPLPRGAA